VNQKQHTFAIIAGGGTAGHVLPGLAIAGALVERGHAPASIHFVGSAGRIESSTTSNRRTGQRRSGWFRLTLEG